MAERPRRCETPVPRVNARGIVQASQRLEKVEILDRLTGAKIGGFEVPWALPPGW
jgi:hypothetical protein